MAVCWPVWRVLGLEMCWIFGLNGIIIACQMESVVAQNMVELAGGNDRSAHADEIVLI